MSTRPKSMTALAILAATLLSSPSARAADPPKGGGGAPDKIIGGGDVGPNEFPYMAGILRRSEPDAYFAQFCGATVIHPRWAVTAAHCVELETPSAIDVLIGAPDLANPGAGQRIAVADIVIFPGYDANTSDGDLALLLLAEPVTGTFPKLATDPATFAPGVIATVLGWGASTTAEDIYPSFLQKVEIPIVDRATAQPFYDQDGITLTDNMVFAGFPEGGRDSCAGDSGGPLLVPDGNGGYLFAGIISFGRPVDCGGADNYGGHTRIASYASWIRSVTSPNRAAWEALFGSDAEGPDLDGDRAAGFAEFAGWTNPASGASLPATVPGMVEMAGMKYPSITFRRLTAPSEVTYGLDFGTGLTSWLPQDTAALQVGAPLPVPGLPQMETVTLRGPAPVAANPSGFLRLNLAPSDTYIPGIRELAFPGFVSGGLSNLETPAPPAGFVKNYRLTGLTPGTAVSVSLRSTQFDAGLSVVNEGTGTVVAEDMANSGGGTDELVTFTPQPGEGYLARVTSDTPSGTGDFTLALFAPYSNLPVISGPGDTAGMLESTDEVDPLYVPDLYYKDDFLLTNAPIGTHVILRQVSGSFNAFLEIVNAETGALLLVDNDSASGGGTDSYLNFVVDSPVPLLVRVSSSFPLETGAYTVTREAGATIAVPEIVNGSLDPTDPVDPNFPGSIYYRDDYYLPNLAADQQVTITVDSPNIDLYLVLVDGVTGGVLEEIDAQFPGTPETFTFTHLEGEHLILRVTSFDFQETGPYTVTTSTTP